MVTVTCVQMVFGETNVKPSVTDVIAAIPLLGYVNCHARTETAQHQPLQLHVRTTVCPIDTLSMYYSAQLSNKDHLYIITFFFLNKCYMFSLKGFE